VGTYRKGFLHPGLSTQFVNNKSDLFDFTMTNVMDSFYSNIMTAYSGEGSFMAVCLSGIDSDNNTGTGTHPLDGRLEADGSFYLIVRPVLAMGSILPDPRGFDKKEDIESIIAMHASTFRARASFNYDGTSPINFGQLITCRFEQGSLLNSDFRDLVFDEPTNKIFDDSYRNLNLKLPDVSTANLYDSNNPTLLGHIGTVQNYSTSIKATSTDNQTFLPWQIPNSGLPIAPNLPHAITSIMGARPNPLNPGAIQASHGGVDIGQATGSPLYAIFDGEVVSLGKSGDPYMADPFNIYTKVGSRGYGLKIVTRHKEKTLAGEDYSFTLEYGHIYRYISDMKVGDKITKGQVIAIVGNRGGSTGPHLHLQMRKGRTAHSGGKLSALAMFGWHNRIDWKSKSLKNKWLNTWPDIASRTT
jgi:murein DD-endopeptidase MepM/ murein hydrolase activator NlpD